MTMTPGEVERKVRQLDNDVQSIYELLTGISAQQARHLNRLNALDSKIDARCDALDSKIDARCDALDSKIDARCDALDSRMMSLETLTGSVETKLNQVLDRLS